MKRWMVAGVVALALVLAVAQAWADEASEKYSESYVAEYNLDYTKALTALEAVPKAEKDSYFYALRRGWLLYCLGKYQDAIDSYGVAVSKQPKSVEPLLGLMLPQMALRLWQDAEKTGKSVLAIDPLNYSANSRLAWTLYNLGRYQDAANAYQKMLELYPSDVDMQSGLGWSQYMLGKTDVAAEHFRAVLKRSPSNVSATDGLAACGK